MFDCHGNGGAADAEPSEARGWQQSQQSETLECRCCNVVHVGGCALVPQIQTDSGRRGGRSSATRPASAETETAGGEEEERAGGRRQEEEERRREGANTGEDEKPAEGGKEEES